MNDQFLTELENIMAGSGRANEKTYNVSCGWTGRCAGPAG